MTELHARPLTEQVALGLAEIIQAARRGAKVRWLTEGNHVREGVARHIVTNSRTAAFPGPTDDIRRCYLRISGTFESFLPIPEVLTKAAAGELSFDQ